MSGGDGREPEETPSCLSASKGSEVREHLHESLAAALLEVYSPGGIGIDVIYV